MIMKTIFRLISTILWFVVFIVTSAGVAIVIQNQFNIATIIIFLVIISILIGLALTLWDKSNKFNKALQIENTVECILNDVDVNYSIQTTDMSTREVPQEILRDMRTYYSSVQLENDMRILQESIDLMRNTKNIETFLSRSDLAQRTSLTIEQAIMAGVRVKEKFPLSKDILNLKIELLPKLLEASYLKIQHDASKLKTDKGKLGRYEKYLDLLEKQEYELDTSENYEDIIHDIKQEINRLSHSNK